MKLDLTTECYLMDMKIDIKKVDMPHMAHFLQYKKATKNTDYSLWQYLWWLDQRIKEFKKLQKNGSCVFTSFEDFLNMKDPVKQKKNHLR